MTSAPRACSMLIHVDILCSATWICQLSMFIHVAQPTVSWLEEQECAACVALLLLSSLTEEVRVGVVVHHSELDSLERRPEQLIVIVVPAHLRAIGEHPMRSDYNRNRRIIPTSSVDALKRAAKELVCISCVDLKACVHSLPDPHGIELVAVDARATHPARASQPDPTVGILDQDDVERVVPAATVPAVDGRTALHLYCVVAPGDVEVPEAVVVVHDVVCFALSARDSVKIRADAQTVPQTRGVAQHLDHAVLQPTTTQHQSNVVWQCARDESSVRANAPGE